MNNIAITINHEYGSGGRDIAVALAEKLNIPCYDSMAIDKMAAEKSGLSVDTMAQWEDRRTPSLLYSLYTDSVREPVSDKIFLAKSEIIKECANTQSCVIVGNCSDYVLRGQENCINIFIYAPFDVRADRVANIYKEDLGNARTFLKKKDKRRADYYNFFSSEKWGNRNNYHIMIDSSFGLDNVVNTLYSLITSTAK